VDARDLHTRNILTHIERDGRLTQRRLARELGIALGLTNLLVRRIVHKGWVKVINIRRNRVQYLITPAGIAEKARVTRAYFENTLRLYTETRDRIRQSLERVSETWKLEDGSSEKRIVFYGGGEVAEIAFICLHSTDLRLVGVVDDERRQPFFGMPVHHLTSICGRRVDGHEFDKIVVMSFRRADEIRSKLEQVGFPMDRVLWLE
jgi:DNA-binding MarR family transcriptional regulator